MSVVSDFIPDFCNSLRVKLIFPFALSVQKFTLNSCRKKLRFAKGPAKANIISTSPADLEWKILLSQDAPAQCIALNFYQEVVFEASCERKRVSDSETKGKRAKREVEKKRKEYGGPRRPTY